MSNIRTYRVNHAMQMISIPLHSTTNSYHLGNNREVVDASGAVTQVTNYYPFGAPYADATAVKGANLQPYKYNGKELDLMHGLNTYDYGARQHDPILARWDRIDPLCEKYYSTSPYVYCLNNPVKHVDPDGRIVETAWDAANVVMDVASCAKNIASGNYVGAGIDALGLLYDAGATIVPGLPGGAGAALKSYRATRSVKAAANTFKAEAKAGKAFEGSVVKAAKADGSKVATQTRLVPMNGKGNVKGNRTNVDGLKQNKDGTYTIIESKNSKSPKLSKGQRAAREHVMDGNQTFKVKSYVKEFGLKPGSEIQVTNYITVFKK